MKIAPRPATTAASVFCSGVAVAAWYYGNALDVFHHPFAYAEEGD